MSGLCGARSAPEQYDYETVWNGGGGLTTVGSQRRGAVVHAVEDSVDEWQERAEHFGKQHAKKFSGDPRGQFLYSAHIVADDRAGLRGRPHAWPIISTRGSGASHCCTIAGARGRTASFAGSTSSAITH